jgi:polysaccharide export outer membrane protein
MKQVFLAIFGVWIGVAAWAQDVYRISPGDVLRIEVLEDASLNRDVLVLPDGSFSFPFAGSVQASGLTIGQVQSAVTQGIASNFATTPNVFVNVRQVQPGVIGAGPAAAPTIVIYFLGEVGSVGPVAIEPGTTLLQALSLSGGFTNFAAVRRIQLRRTDPATGQQYVSEIDYRAIANGARLREDIVLADGDVILVPERRLFE